MQECIAFRCSTLQRNAKRVCTCASNFFFGMRPFPALRLGVSVEFDTSFGPFERTERKEGLGVDFDRRPSSMPTAAKTGKARGRLTGRLSLSSFIFGFPFHVVRGKRDKVVSMPNLAQDPQHHTHRPLILPCSLPLLSLSVALATVQAEPQLASALSVFYRRR